MSIRFAIKNTSAKAEKEGDVIVRYSGVSEPFRRTSERTATKVGQDKDGNPILSFATGLDTDQLEYFKWFTEEEKVEVRKQIERYNRACMGLLVS